MLYIKCCFTYNIPHKSLLECFNNAVVNLIKWLKHTSNQVSTITYYFTKPST